jgi:glycosyltransferase involved in cell wall biosynthesis
MAGWVPAIGLRGEDGPEEIAAAGGGMTLAEPGGLRAAIERTLADRERLGREARATVQSSFTWDATGRATVAAYEEAVGRR